jgi:hypothetical protein
LVCNLGKPIGEIRVVAKTAVPTVEMEKEGIRAKDFKNFVSPSWLRPTPPQMRRRLLEAANQEIPEDLERRTRHLFPGSPVSVAATQPAGELAAAASPQASPKGKTKKASTGSRKGRGTNKGEAEVPGGAPKAPSTAEMIKNLAGR